MSIYDPEKNRKKKGLKQKTETTEQDFHFFTKKKQNEQFINKDINYELSVVSFGPMGRYRARSVRDSRSWPPGRWHRC